VVSHQLRYCSDKRGILRCRGTGKRVSSFINLLFFNLTFKNGVISSNKFNAEHSNETIVFATIASYL
jgi:hypothetical protein